LHALDSAGGHKVFLRNAWYVAAWDREISRTLTAVEILGERIVLYRKEDGEPVALEDACPHRKTPLSMGRIVGDQIECGYHGLTFNSEGRCTRVPGATRIPGRARVRNYPAVSRYGLVWIWMGEAAKALPNQIFAIEHWDEPGWGRNQGGTMTVDCNYLYITDNLLDPSHVAWVHRTSFGNEGYEDQPVRAAGSESGVIASRWLRDVEVAPFYAPFTTFTGRCDRLQHYEVRFPSHAIIRAVFVPAGSGGADRPLHEQALVMDSYNFMTPVNADQTRYYWFQIRNFSPNDASVSKTMDEGVRAAFAEDRVILNAVHKGFANKVTSNIDLEIDRAPLQFRRALRDLINAEQPSAG